MWCLGGRYDEQDSEKLWLLFVTFWEKVTLLEVSGDYFEACGGILAFATTKFEFNKPLESCYKTTPFRVAECSCQTLERQSGPRSW
jgi:hypothetical protein